MKLHADGCIIKPVRIDDLLNSVKEQLRKQDEGRKQNISNETGEVFADKVLLHGHDPFDVKLGFLWCRSETSDGFR